MVNQSGSGGYKHIIIIPNNYYYGIEPWQSTTDELLYQILIILNMISYVWVIKNYTGC